MLAGVCVGSNDLSKASAFYDEVLATIGMSRTMQNHMEVGYGPTGEPGTFWVLRPFNGQVATAGNGSQVMFVADTKEQVDAFHQAAMDAGARNDGAPGKRDYRKGYYGAYCRDLDGNKLHVFYIAADH